MSLSLFLLMCFSWALVLVRCQELGDTKSFGEFKITISRNSRIMQDPHLSRRTFKEDTCVTAFKHVLPFFAATLLMSERGRAS